MRVGAATDNSQLFEVATKIGQKKISFIIDTGASVTILPHSLAPGLSINSTPVRLSAANGETIKCFGEIQLDIIIPGLRRSYPWTVVIADTINPLLGADFLRHYGLILNCSDGRLIDETTRRYVQGGRVTARIQNITVNNHSDLPERIQSLLQKFPKLTRPRTEQPLASNTRVTHVIDTGDNAPTYAKVRQLSEEKYEAAKREFAELLKAGIVRPSKSPWSSPIHLVPKPTTGKWRVCGDFRHLNHLTKPDRYPIPNINSLGSKLFKKKIFSKIDLLQAYHQIPIQKADIEKSAVITPFGLFEYLFMPFGLRNSSSTFQRFMDSIFMDVGCVFVYIDDILVFSESEEQHHSDLEKVLSLLEENNLKISIDKCQFYKSNIEFLGYNASAEGLKPTAQKVKDIKNFPEPTDSKSLRRFLGMINFYRKLIPQAADVLLPLTEAIKHNPAAKTLELGPPEKEAFVKIKDILAEVSTLTHPDPNATQYHLVTDSSNYAVGAALHQMINGESIPIGFYSRKLSESQKKYSTFNRELLAAYQAVLHFKPQIEGRNVTLFSDHKPLSLAFKKKTPMKSDLQQRYLSIITEYVVDVSYIRGEDNIVADCLSRPVCAVTIDPCDLPAISESQKTDEELKT